MSIFIYGIMFYIVLSYIFSFISKLIISTVENRRRKALADDYAKYVQQRTGVTKKGNNA